MIKVSPIGLLDLAVSFFHLKKPDFVFVRYTSFSLYIWSHFELSLSIIVKSTKKDVFGCLVFIFSTTKQNINKHNGGMSEDSTQALEIMVM